jgi:hypothetical protein
VQSENVRQIAEHLQERDRLREIDPTGMVGIDAESAVVRKRIRKWKRRTKALDHVPGHRVEEREPHAH